ncbi:MAG: glucose-phosphate cytidylyltransferase, partial [Candidatus Eremiobacteraeota bacterium]|nr:glucose-phosphate cytidylyltransferase [Candidatus Eremiobacteraeota bacterium]
LMAYRHESFWQCMDTVRDRKLLEELWASGKAPWIASAPGRLLEAMA